MRGTERHDEAEAGVWVVAAMPPKLLGSHHMTKGLRHSLGSAGSASLSPFETSFRPQQALCLSASRFPPSWVGKSTQAQQGLRAPLTLGPDPHRCRHLPCFDTKMQFIVAF